MTKHIGCGARATDTSEPFGTKKALRDAVTTDPASVWVYSTDMYGTPYNGPLADMPTDPALVFSVVGPDPFRARTWYASVTHNGTAWSVK